GRFTLGLQAIAAVGEHDDLVAAHQEPARLARHLLLAVTECEACQVTRVLGPDAEERVDPDVVHARANALDALRASGAIGLGPASPIGPGRWRAKVGRRRPASHASHG